MRIRLEKRLTPSRSMQVATPVASGDYFLAETVTILAWKGDYEVRVAVATSGKYDLADAYNWAEQQLALLPAS